MWPNLQLRIRSHLLKKSFMENFIFCAVQVTQNKCMRFCLNLEYREHISDEHFKRLKVATNKSNVQAIYHLYSIHICSK